MLGLPGIPYPVQHHRTFNLKDLYGIFNPINVSVVTVMVPMFLVHKVMVPLVVLSHNRHRYLTIDDSGQSPPNGVTYSTSILHHS
jgi:hypothetical protein